MRLLDSDHGAPGTCRCGTKLLGTTRRTTIVGAPASLSSLLEGQPFCSRNCIRAFFLEAMEAFDAFDSAGLELTVSDLHSVYRALARTFAEILHEPARGR